MSNFTDYTDELSIDEGDRLQIQAESDAVDSLNGELEITARSALASETVSDEPGFEHSTSNNRVELQTENGQTLTLLVRTMESFDSRDDVIAKIQMAGGKTIAKVTDIEVLN